MKGGGSMLFDMYLWLGSRLRDERGDIAAWTLILLMSASLVIAVFGIARERLLDIVSAALSNVCGGVGC